LQALEAEPAVLEVEDVCLGEPVVHLHVPLDGHEQVRELVEQTLGPKQQVALEQIPEIWMIMIMMVVVIGNGDVVW